LKKRSQNCFQQPSSEDQLARPYTHAIQPILVEPCLHKSHLHRGCNSERTSRPADCQNDWRNTLQQKSSEPIWRPAFHPVQQPGNCTLPWPIKSSGVARPSSHWQYVQESDADVAVDVDCCGDSGSMSKLCLTHPTAPTRLKIPSPKVFVNTASAQGFSNHKRLSDVDTKGSQVWCCCTVSCSFKLPPMHI